MNVMFTFYLLNSVSFFLVNVHSDNSIDQSIVTIGIRARLPYPKSHLTVAFTG